jgi:multisubunit Na+/H+ antiporter MnhF subunit
VNSLDFLSIFLALLLFPASWRLVQGPRFQDRVLSLSLISAIVVLILVTVGVRSAQVFFLDIAMVYALLSFGEVSAFVWIRKRRHEGSRR